MHLSSNKSKKKTETGRNREETAIKVKPTHCAVKTVHAVESDTYVYFVHHEGATN